MGRDRISELDDCLLNQILVHLKTEESIRTSVLSKRWRNLWPNVPGLDLKLTDFPAHGEIFESLLDTYLDFNRGHLQKFKIDYEHDLYYLSDRFVGWIAIAVDRRIQHLDVQTHNASYAIDFMPTNIYKSKTLVSLKLSNVGLENPMFAVSLPCLKIIHLENILFGKDGSSIMENLVSGCPVLEDLTVIRLYTDFLEFLPLLRVRSQSLKVFRLTFGWITGSTDYAVEIDAPGLKYMSLMDEQSDRIVGKNLNSLVKVDLDTDFNVKYGGSPLVPEDLRKRDVIRDFLIGISSVRHIIISKPTLEVLYHYSKLGPIPKFHNLSRLQAAFSSQSLQLLPDFLDSCPNLKSLIMDMEPEEINFTNVPRCLTSTLEYVEINKLILKEETGIKLVNYFLENAAVLKKLTMSFKDSPMSSKASDIMKLFTTTKLSRRCQLQVDDDSL